MYKTLLPLIFVVAACASLKAKRSGERAIDLSETCGQIFDVKTHGSTMTRYSLVPPAATSSKPVLMMMAGNGGELGLAANGCAKYLNGNPLLRVPKRMTALGYHVALIDSDSDHGGEDGLAGFRASQTHADDLEKIAADLATRTGRKVWIVGHSRGSISAASFAAKKSSNPHLSGVVLASSMFVGHAAKLRPWAEQTIFDFALESIRVPTLIIGHVGDLCDKSVPGKAASALKRIGAAKKESILISGGVGPGSDYCGAKGSHGFGGQDAEFVEAIDRFVSAAK